MPVPPPLPLQTKAPPADNPPSTLLQFQFLDNVGEQLLTGHRAYDNSRVLCAASTADGIAGSGGNRKTGSAIGLRRQPVLFIAQGHGGDLREPHPDKVMTTWPLSR